eukprot:453642-Rhodomonas_salina.2
MERDGGGMGGSIPAILLRACYAMSGTDLVYAPILLRASYAMSGTDIGWFAARWGCRYNRHQGCNRKGKRACDGWRGGG